MIFYDIESNPVRTKLHNKLEALGFVRLQYSVFCGMHSDSQWRYCRDEIDQVIKDKLGPGDKLNIMTVKPIDLRQMHFLGEPADLDAILNPPKILWI
ncbi:MAG: CRISPR-associated endonuclease Cas2 [Saprospiraceae bacterium]|nr:CRISPR-associated endonuclease Cas2 [Saprospiraceae bacterium]